MDVLGHDSHTLGVQGAQVGVLEQASHVGLSGLLEGQQSVQAEPVDQSGNRATYTPTTSWNRTTIAFLEWPEAISRFTSRQEIT